MRIPNTPGPCFVHISRTQAGSLIKALSSLRGWKIPRSGHEPVPVEDVLLALYTIYPDMGSLEAFMDRYRDPDGSVDYSAVENSEETPYAPVMGRGIETEVDPLTEYDEIEYMADLMECLTPRQHLVIRLRYGLSTGYPLTLPEIAKLLGITKQSVFDIENSALERMRAEYALKEAA